MSEATEFDIGNEVACTDGVCGVLRRVVVDPVAKAITHLAVDPKHGRATGHLVPIKYVASAGKQIQLTCTKAQFDEFDDAEESDYMPIGQVEGYTQGDVFVLPYYSLRTAGAGGSNLPLLGSTTHSELETQDRIPVGEVQFRRGDAVEATDGSIGHIEGLVVDPSDHHVTHFLLQEGHLWGRKQVAIPIGAVDHVGAIVRLSLSKDEVRDLPPVDVGHPTA
jgi:sporulation protein YlmC with PRC-barrel domain